MCLMERHLLSELNNDVRNNIVSKILIVGDMILPGVITINRKKYFKLENERTPNNSNNYPYCCCYHRCKVNQVSCSVDISQPSANLPQKKLPPFSAVEVFGTLFCIW
jgi:hypothetical protein